MIPARGGSKGVPRKNLRTVGGTPLVVRAVETCLGSGVLDRVVVSTDDPEIAQVAALAGAEVIARPSELAQDDSTSEAVLTHALLECEFSPERGVLLLVQCTSPFINPNDLARAVELVAQGSADSVFSACPDHGFLWRHGNLGFESVNHDSERRPRRQDLEPTWRETGGFYAMSLAGYERSRRRFFGRKAIVEVDRRFAIDIDEESDLELAEAMSSAWLAGNDSWPSRSDLDLLVTDFDGVHTDDRVWVDQDGREAVVVNRRDGLAVRQLQSSGLPVLMLSTETNPVVEARARKLSVECLSGSSDKASDLMTWVEAHGVALERVAFLGNDLNDLDVMSRVGWPIAVSDACPEVLASARLVTTSKGGTGVLREIFDRIVRQRS